MFTCNIAVIRCRDLLFRTMNSGTSASRSSWTIKSMCRCFFKVENWDLLWLEVQAAPTETFWWFLKRCWKTSWNYWESSAHLRAASTLTNTLQNYFNLKLWFHLRGLLVGFVFFWWIFIEAFKSHNNTFGFRLKKNVLLVSGKWRTEEKNDTYVSIKVENAVERLCFGWFLIR